MESINFNDFSPKERYEIIRAFLIKMRKANSIPSAQRFFEHYLRKFYKLPDIVVSDIAYCQRAMKTHLVMHQTISRVFDEQMDADPVIKNTYLHEIEDILCEINAECQYMLMRLQDDINRFCLAFAEHDLKPNDQVVNDIISGAIVPLVVAEKVAITPQYVGKRPTEEALMQKYFIDTTMSTPKLPLHAYTTAVVKESRLNLQAALARTRIPQIEKSAVKQEGPKEEFMLSVGLITHVESQRIRLLQVVKKSKRPLLPPKQQ
ncbi:uncharacterized protein LOC117185886 [Drosophila miranda]|uniref:uncharacterized protein LOC117185886 n=1 Tax=Drosophila miranda TaxID=7229 RepID=UPI0007E798FA|nr:uncharacterized protein LOC117185886 [Drosophila miranda]